MLDGTSPDAETSATNYPPLGGPLVCRPVPVPTPRETSATSIATTPRCAASIQSQLPYPGASSLPAGSSPDAIPGAPPAKKSKCQCKQAAKESGKPSQCPSLHHFAAASDSGTWCVPPSSSGRIRLYPSHDPLPLPPSSHLLVHYPQGNHSKPSLPRPSNTFHALITSFERPETHTTVPTSHFERGCSSCHVKEKRTPFQSGTSTLMINSQHTTSSAKN